jgi:hypothetical protein
MQLLLPVMDKGPIPKVLNSLTLYPTLCMAERALDGHRNPLRKVIGVVSGLTHK